MLDDLTIGRFIHLRRGTAVLALVDIHRLIDPLPDASLRDSLAADRGEVLPHLPFWAVADALRRLPRDEIRFSLQNKVLPIVCIPGL